MTGMCFRERTLRGRRRLCRTMMEICFELMGVRGFVKGLWGFFRYFVTRLQRC